MNDYRNDTVAPAIEQQATAVMDEARASLLDAISILDLWEGRPSAPASSGGGNLANPVEGVVSIAFSTRSAAFELRERLQGLRNRIGTL